MKNSPENTELDSSQLKIRIQEQEKRVKESLGHLFAFLLFFLASAAYLSSNPEYSPQAQEIGLDTIPQGIILLVQTPAGIVLLQEYVRQHTLLEILRTKRKNSVAAPANTEQTLSE